MRVAYTGASRRFRDEQPQCVWSRYPTAGGWPGGESFYVYSPEGMSNAPPSPGDDMEVDNTPSTSTTPPSNISQKRLSRSNAKQNYRDLGKESSSEEIQGPAPSKTKKAKHHKSSTASRTAMTSSGLRLQVQQNRPVPPIIIGTQCMQFDIIDLKTIKVSLLKCPIVTK